MIKTKSSIAMITRPSPEYSDRTQLLRLDKNERTTVFSKDEFDDMMATITPFDFVAYAELEPTYESFAKWLNIKRENLLLTFGSDVAIKTVFETFVETGDEVLNFDPNYAMFSVYTKMFGGIEIVKQYNSDFSIDIDNLINSINKKTKLIIISNPGHNGIATPVSDILRVVESAKANNAIILIDEAYYHFSDVTMLNHFDQNNIIIIRSLSKAFGLASLRVGFIIAEPNLIKEMYRVKLVHEVDGFAAKIAKYMVEHSYIMENYVEDVKAGHNIIKKRFEQMGITLFPSHSNFVYFKVNRMLDINRLIKDLKQKNIIIKSPIKAPPFNNLLRITLGNAHQMELFCNELQIILDSITN